ncbi:zinc-ribbon domain-containing protein [Miniphocaeibacter halophilus]|uniref:Uncharacterized protein n=1 Tax=Miniphocaeibacter halophilus TaxID=2931922 RepID=A0AC61MZE3_9FIRM|nr:zinc-ribbon domain-containing protein [Miniphocaeibacter halophilus]QQK08539.1 hypothetical protein JFY71_03095 [Miniphocaeibacter halophilus]
MRCKYCGEKIEKDYKFCISCGKPIENFTENNKEKSQSTQTIEYYEIETDMEKKEGKYDFSQFLSKDEVEEELEEIDISTDKNKKVHAEYQDETSRYNVEDDDLEDTKKRILFERSDYNLFDSIKKNKEKKKEYFDKSSINDEPRKNNDEEKEKPRSRFSNFRKEDNRKRKEDYSNEKLEEERIEKKKRRKRIWKRIRNIIYNILVTIMSLVLSTVLVEPARYYLMEIFSIDLSFLGDKIINIGILFIILFLLLPFFNCKGNAKIPLFFLCILLSWTIIGWIILLIVSIMSNRKWKRNYW